MNVSKKKQIIEAYLESRKGLVKLGKSIQKNLIERLDYHSLLNMLLENSSSIRKTKYYIDQKSNFILNIPDRISPTTNIADRFERMIDLTQQQLIRFEETKIFQLIESMHLKTLQIKKQNLNQDFFDSVYSSFKYSKILMNAKSYAVVRKWIRIDDKVHDHHLLRTSGIFALINEAPIYIRRIAPVNKIFLFQENLGKIQKFLDIKFSIHNSEIKESYTEQIIMSLNSKSIKIIEVMPDFTTKGILVRSQGMPYCKIGDVKCAKTGNCHECTVE